MSDCNNRCESALRNYEERREAGEDGDAESVPNFVLMMLVGMSDPGLVILPTHRLVSGIPELTAEQVRKLLQADFELETVGRGEQAARDTWEWIEADGGQNLLGFGSVSDGVWQ